MADEEKDDMALWRARLDKIKRDEIAAGVVSWWWLSFADAEKFRGVCIVRAFGMIDAVLQTHLLGINPGGSVSGHPWPADKPDPPESARKRCLSRDELATVFGELIHRDGSPA